MIPGRRPGSGRSCRKPRASGDDPRAQAKGDVLTRVNPARAGMIPRHSKRLIGRIRKPRASGDDPSIFMLDDAAWW